MQKTANSEHKSPVGRILDFVGSLWFGISTMVLILLYCWLGSAGTQPFLDWFPRQTFDKTEMEWFTWWPFNLLIALLAVSLITGTLRRIPFNKPNWGVYMVHFGILVMILGAVVYYGMKIEGDMAVYRRQAVISVDGGPGETLIIRPREQGVVRGSGRVFRVSVADLNPAYELLTGEDKGKKTFAAQLRFDPMGGGGQPFIRQLLVGYPQYTEDVLPGEGRAVKVLGKPLVDEGVEVELDYASTDRLFIHGRYALYAREFGAGEWSQLEIDSVPRYHEHVALAGDAFVPHGAPQPAVGRLDLRPEVTEGEDDFLEGVGIRVVGYLPYAQEVTDWVSGGSQFNPLMTFTLAMGDASQTETLRALDPRTNQLSFGPNLPTVTFRWIEDPADLERLRQPSDPRLVVTAPGLDEPRVVPLSEVQGRELALEGTQYTIALEQLFPNWQMASQSGTAQLALVRVTGPKGTFRRAVIAPDASLSQDISDSGHMDGSGFVDPDIRIELEGVRESGLVLVAGPVGLHALMLDDRGVVEEHSPSIGQQVGFFDDQLRLSIDKVSESAQQVRKPRIAPHQERQRRVGDAYSMVQVEIRQGSKAENVWLEYSHYAHPNRSGFRPENITLEDGRRLQVLFSRQSMTLPTEVALEEFQLEVFPGGERERDYISLVRFKEEGDWSRVHEVRSNQPTEHEGWWFFQSTWDPPAPQMGYAGMNYTGLGVGNRHGVGIMLLGSILTIVGSIWAFYVKPVLIRRRRDADLAAPEPAPAPAQAAQ